MSEANLVMTGGRIVMEDIVPGVGVLSDPESVPDQSTGIDAIMEMMADQDTPISDISRLIALEIAGIVKLMGQVDPLQRKGMKDLVDHVRALRELQRTLTEADLLSRKDTLNIDGPKFQFLFKTIVGFFGKSMKEAGADDAFMQRVMLVFGDMVKTNDETIRRDINKIDSGR